MSGPITLAEAAGDATQNATSAPAIVDSNWLPIALKTGAVLSGVTTFCHSRLRRSPQVFFFHTLSPMGSLIRHTSDTILQTSAGKFGRANIWNG